MSALALLAKVPVWAWIAGAGVATVVTVKVATATPKAPPPAPANVLPPPPTKSPALLVPAWFKPKDDLSVNGVLTALQLTVRQVQWALNYVGRNPPLDVNGNWDLPTQQAVWDFQKQTSDSLPKWAQAIPITGEFDVLTQGMLVSAVATKSGQPIPALQL